MADLSLISAGFAGLNASLNLLKAAGETRDAVQIAAAISEVQGKLLATQSDVFTAQAAQAKLVETVSGLKQQLAKFEAWDAEKQRYQLEKLPPGIFVYTLKSEHHGSEPAHSICQTCYQRGKKSILHEGEKNFGIHSLTCKECGSSLYAGIAQRIDTGSRDLY